MIFKSKLKLAVENESQYQLENIEPKRKSQFCVLVEMEQRKCYERASQFGNDRFLESPGLVHVLGHRRF